MILDKKMATKCKYEWHKGEVKMTKDKPPLLNDEEIVKAVGYKYGHCVSPFDRNIAQAQRDADIKWFNQWLEGVVASGKVKCPDCAWNLFQGAEHIGMTPCNHCNSTGFITEPLRMEEK